MSTVRTIRDTLGGAVLLWTALGTTLLCAAWLGWSYWRDEVAESPRYVVGEVLLTPAAPAWIKADVKTEALRDAGPGPLRLLDPDLGERLATALAAHPWIARVIRIRKEYGDPPRVIAAVEYRRPAAMVEVIQNGQPGLLPVDGDGVLLPPADFSPNEAKEYLRITVASLPGGPVGGPWGDARVTGAAGIAAAWGDRWRAVEAYRIEAVRRAPGAAEEDEPPVFTLFTRGGRKVLWGHAVGSESLGEPKAEEKIARLEAYVQEAGRLDATTAGPDLDLRNADGLVVVPQTARRPGAAPK